MLEGAHICILKRPSVFAHSFFAPRIPPSFGLLAFVSASSRGARTRHPVFKMAFPGTISQALWKKPMFCVVLFFIFFLGKCAYVSWHTHKACLLIRTCVRAFERATLGACVDVSVRVHMLIYSRASGNFGRIYHCISDFYLVFCFVLRMLCSCWFSSCACELEQSLGL